MENLAASGLPEVDSLPDGFVESAAEPVRPMTQSPAQENYRVSDASGLDNQNQSNQESSHGETETILCAAEKTQKSRNFPVPLSETENYDASLELLDENNERGDGEQLTHHSNDSCLEALAELSGRSEVKELAPGEIQNFEMPADENSDAQATAIKEIPLSISSQAAVKEMPLSPNDQASKSTKPEASESKRKNVKRNSKSDKDILEFTLKYQQVLAERDTAIVVRDKLESLCRELQRQNKMLMEECKRVARDGQSLRSELSTKFQDAIKDVSNKLENQKDECISQLKENEMLKIKLKQLADQYVLSEQRHEQELKQKALELQIAELKMKQHEEKMKQEQSQMKIYAEQVSQLLATEKSLRSQLTADGEKFQQFQDALVKSNEVFETFKQEMEKMSKSMKDLKKENTFMKSKCEKSDFTLVKLVEERELTKKEMEKLKNQKEKLESLCRTLQAERRQNSLVSSSSDPPQS